MRDHLVAARTTGGEANDSIRVGGPRHFVVPVPHPSSNPSLTKLVSRRLFGDTPRETVTSELVPLWHSAVGDGDLDVELRNFLIHNTDTDLNDSAAALLCWLARPAEHAAAPGPRPVLGVCRVQLRLAVGSSGDRDAPAVPGLPAPPGHLF